MELFICFLAAILYGLVEGVTEWLPVSSTGHMILLSAVPGLNIAEKAGPEFYEFFLAVIQLGAVMAVIISYFRKLWPFGKKKGKEQKKDIWRLWLKILIGCVPAGFFGVLLKLLPDSVQEGLNSTLTVSIALILYGILFIAIEQYLKLKDKRLKATLKGKQENASIFRIDSLSALDYKTCLFIGLFQVLSLIPGTSRSGVTILSALLFACTRSVAAEYSFCLSLPIMVGASLVEGISFAGAGVEFTGEMGIYIGVGTVVAFLVSLVTIKALVKWVSRHTFEGFGIYRIAVGALTLGLLLGGII